MEVAFFPAHATNTRALARGPGHVDKALLEFKAWEKMQFCLRDEGHGSGRVRDGCHHTGGGSHAKSLMAWPERARCPPPKSASPVRHRGCVSPCDVHIYSLTHSLVQMAVIYKLTLGSRHHGAQRHGGWSGRSLQMRAWARLRMGCRAKEHMRQKKNTWATGLLEGREKAGEGGGEWEGDAGGGGTATAPAQPASSTQEALAQPFTQGDRVMACVPASPRQKPEDVLGTLRFPCYLHREDGAHPVLNAQHRRLRRASKGLGQMWGEEPTRGPGHPDALKASGYLVCSCALEWRKGASEKRAAFSGES